MLIAVRQLGSRSLLLAAAFTVPVTPSAPHLDATLVRVSRPGLRPVRALLTLAISPGWHIAAEHPGTIGLATHVRWQLPQGWRLLDAEWPAPKRSVEGSDTLYTYEGQTVVQLSFDAPTAFSAAPIRGLISYGLCRDVCIPERQTVTLTP